MREKVYFRKSFGRHFYSVELDLDSSLVVHFHERMVLSAHGFRLGVYQKASCHATYISNFLEATFAGKSKYRKIFRQYFVARE